MTFDDCLRAELANGNPPMVALHNAAQRFAESLKPRDSSQYADETAHWACDELKLRSISLSGGMLQALPSRSDLVRAREGGHERLVAAYEVLLDQYQSQAARSDSHE